MAPKFELTRLFTNEMSIVIPAWEMSFETSIGYHWINHRFCIDVATYLDSANDFYIKITENMKFV
jgi:hypothetical protein